MKPFRIRYVPKAHKWGLFRQLKNGRAVLTKLAYTPEPLMDHIVRRHRRLRAST